MPNCAWRVTDRDAADSAAPERQQAIAAAPRPAQRPLHRLARGGGRGGMREALVEHHRDVGAELCLNVGRLLRGQKMSRAVEVRPELHTVLVDRSARREAEDLVPAAVGENRTRPADEPVQPPRRAMRSSPGRR